MEIELLISGVKGTFLPVICGDIRLSSQIWGAGCLRFAVLKEGSIDFKEGDTVTLRADGRDMFYGYVFSKARTKKGIIYVTCYDQMRYLKNRDTYVFSGQTASQIFSRIASDYKIKTGETDDTGYVLPERIEDNTELMDILYTAIKLTGENGYGSYIIYDDHGSLCLKNMRYMNSNLVADNDTVIDFDYKTSIDKGVYNKIKLIYKRDTKYTHTLNVFSAQDDKAIEEWGMLQYFRHIDINKYDGNSLANELLKICRIKKRSLKILTFGNVNIRAGWNINVNLDIGDFVINEPMRIRECCHIFDGNSHNMELALEGGVLNE